MAVEPAGLPGITSDRYQRLFQEAPVAFFEVSVDSSSHESPSDGPATERMRVIGVNRQAAALMDLATAEDLLEALPDLVQRSEVQTMFGEVFALMAGGATSGDVKMQTTTVAGSPLSLMLRWVATGSETAQTRTLLLAVTDLTRQQDDATRLRQLFDRQDRLIASVSHELRTPLAAVLGLATELRDRAAGMTVDDLTDLAGIIAQQSTVISTIIDDLLALVRMQGASLSVSAEPVDLHREVKAVVDAIASAVERVTIIGTGVAVGDPLRARQVLRNVLTNALRYGGRRIEVRIGNRSDLATVEVVDDGRGIDAERAETIFDPFERAHADSGQTSSLGLGLTVARGLARLMDGDLAYERQQGATCFRMTLPAPANASALESVRELVYQSRATDAFTPDLLVELLTECRRNNRLANLTGLLLYHEGDFLQVLEGPAEAVELVFDKIRADPRHYRVNVVLDRNQSRRSFPDWEMGWYSFDDQLARSEGVSEFLVGHNLPPRVDRYVRILLESFRGSD